MDGDVDETGERRRRDAEVGGPAGERGGEPHRTAGVVEPRLDDRTAAQIADVPQPQHRLLTHVGSRIVRRLDEDRHAVGET